MKYCRHCKRLSFQKKFCRKCGSELTACSRRCKVLAIGGTLCAVLLICITWNHIIPEFYKIKPGVYEVGVDIPAGEYVAAADAPGMFGRVSGTVYQNDPHTGHVTDFDFAENSNVTFTVEDGQFIELEDGYMYQSNKPSLLKPFRNSGVFLVGRDLLPGVYVITNTNTSYNDAYHVYTDIKEDGELINMRQLDTVPAGESTVVTLKWGDYIDTGNFCRMSLRPVMLWEFGKEKHAIKTSEPTKSATESTDVQQDIPEGCFGNGTYEVGVDISAGEYVIDSDGTDFITEIPKFHLTLYSDASCSEESLLLQERGDYNTILRLETGQVVVIENAYLYESSGESRLVPFEIGGFFHVGRDIPPGTYTIISDNINRDGTCCLYSGLYRDEAHLLLETTVERGGSTEITLEEGNYIWMQYCHLEE